MVLNYFIINNIFKKELKELLQKYFIKVIQFSKMDIFKNVQNEKPKYFYEK